MNSIDPERNHGIAYLVGTLSILTDVENYTWHRQIIACARFKHTIIRNPRLTLSGLAIVLVLCVALIASQFTDEKLTLGPQQTVYTINPKIGVHTRLTDEVEESKIRRTLEMVREMGSPWIIEYFPWAYVEPEPGAAKWTHTDQVIKHANRQGLRIIARLGFVPAWARPPETTPLYLDENHFADFGSYAAKFVERYANEVDHIIVWNEPNLALEWGFQPVDPEHYVELLKVVYPMVKEVNPNVQVLAGALAPTLAPADDSMAMNDLVYLQKMYDAGAADYFDILAIHAYGFHFPPETPADPDVINLRRSELLREIMVRNGDAHKRAMITEGGWNDHPRWTRAVRPGQRIEYTISAYQLGLEEWAWLDVVGLWAFRYPWDQKSYQDYYTFVSTDFEPKPIYLEVQRYAAGQTD